MIIAIIAAYLIVGAFLAGWFQSRDAATAVAVTIAYPLIPVMVFAAWLRELIHAVRNRRDLPPSP